MKTSLVIVVLCVAGYACAEDAKLTGAWRVKGIDPKMGDGEVAIVQSHNALKLLSRQKEGKWSVIGGGTVKDHAVTFQLTDDPSPYSFLFSGTKTLVPTGTNSLDKQVTVAFVSSLFSCGNHSPSNHVATSLKDMKQLTAKYHCAGWHSVDPKAESVALRLDKLMENMAPIGE